MQNALLAEINNLSVAERILLVEDIWDHIVDTDDFAFALSESNVPSLTSGSPITRNSRKQGVTGAM